MATVSRGIGVAATSMTLATLGLFAQPAPTSGLDARMSPEQARATLTRYCVGCHNNKLKTGGLTLEELDVARIADHAETGEKIVRKLRAGMMPPSGMPRPEPATYTLLAGEFERILDAAAKATLAAPGAHRLNRKEYGNAIRDLLALEVDISSILPVDDSSYGFDNMAGTLGVSPALIDSYISAAAKISRLALGHDLTPTMRKFIAPADYSQDSRLDGLSFGTRGGLLARYYFPADGDYVINWAPVRNNAGGLFGSETKGEQVELTLDEKRLKLFDFDTEVARNSHDDKHEVRIPVTAGMRTVGLAFVSTTHVPSNDLNQHPERTLLVNGTVGGFTFAPHLAWMSVSGPYNGKRPEHTPSRDRVFVCRPASAADELPCAEKILAALATRAYRRPVVDNDLEILLRFYQTGRNDGDFEDGIQRALQMILSHPEFIFRTEDVPVNVKDGQSYRVSDLQLASRLSFFLWSSVPDEELLKLASAGKLRSPGVLEQQVKRMLADTRSHELVSNFAGQWLQLRNLDAASPVVQVFPDFDDNLRRAFRTETEMFFESVIREDRNVVDLLNADYTFLNERLARHYGIPNVYGSQFRRVQLGPEFDMRRGLLGQGSILTVTSVADRTSPVLRGKWVLLNMLGVIPPDPPPNVPQLKQSDVKANGQEVAVTISMRKRMEEHRANPACASCHKMMDPIGFALESFDAVGKYRVSEFGEKLDLSGGLVDGSKFDGPTGLRQDLVRYAPQFEQTLTERLLTYALGRGVEYYDMPAVRRIVKSAAVSNNRFSALVLGIVNSEPFQMNQRTADIVASTSK
jgi:hypothetical protein